MKKTRTRWCIRLAILALPALSILNLQETRAASKSDAIVAMDLLTVKEPGSQAESRLRVIRLTTRGGAKGYGDYFDFGLPAGNEEEMLARLVNRPNSSWKVKTPGAPWVENWPRNRAPS